MAKKTVAEAIYAIKGDNSGLGKAVKDSDKQVQGLLGSFQNLNVKSVGAFLGIGLSVRAVGRELISTAKEIDRGSSQIIKATGATGKEAERLQETFLNVARRVPQSIEQVSLVVGDLRTRLGLTGRALERASKDFLDFARVNNVDVQSATRNLTRLMADWGVEMSDSRRLLDELTVASQKSGVQIDTLAGIAVNYGVQLRAVGFSQTEAIALLSKFEKEGVSVEKMVSGLSIALGRLAQEGIDDTAEGFAELIRRISETESVGEATREAIELLGQRAGPDFALAVKEGRFEIDEYVSALQNASGALEDTSIQSLSAEEAFEMLKRELVLGLEPAFETVTKATLAFVRGLRQAKVDQDNYIDSLSEVSEEAERLRGLLIEARESGDDHRVSMLEQALEANKLEREMAELNNTLADLDRQRLGWVDRLFGSDVDVERRRTEALERQREIIISMRDLQPAVSEVSESTDEFNENIERNNKLTDDQQKAIDEAKRKFEGFQGSMINFISQAKQVKDSIENDLTNSFSKFGEDIENVFRDSTETLAGIVLNAEESIKDLQERIAKEEDDIRKGQLQKELDEQKEILKAREGFEQRQADRVEKIREKLTEAGIDAEKAGLENLLEIRSLEEEIEEKRRLASLDEFTRFEEQQDKRIDNIIDNFLAEINILEEKLHKQKAFEGELTEFLFSEQAKRLENTDNWVQEMLQKHGELAEGLRNMMSLQGQLRQIDPSANQPQSVVNNNISAPVTISPQQAGQMTIEEISNTMGFNVKKHL